MPGVYRKSSRVYYRKRSQLPIGAATSTFVISGDIPLSLGINSPFSITYAPSTSIPLTLGLEGNGAFSHTYTINDNSLPLTLGLSHTISRVYSPDNLSIALILSLSAIVEQIRVYINTGSLPLTLGLESNVTTVLVTPTVTTVEGITRNEVFKRFLRETGLGVYGTVTGVAGGATTTFDDTTRLKSSQFNEQDWVGAWARISKNADSLGNAPENEVQAVTTYDPTTNGRITAGTFTSNIAVADEYELWRFPNPKTVIEDLNVCLTEDILLPCWSILSEAADFDMEQNNTTDWTAVTGAISKVSTGNPYISGKRYLALTTTNSVGLWKTANKIKVEPGKKYHASIIGLASDADNELTFSAYDETNSATIDSITWDRQYPGRMKLEFTTPDTCHQITLRGGHDDTSGASYWDDLCFYPTDAYDIALPWWVKNKNQIKGIFDINLESIGTNVYDTTLRGQVTNQYDIQDNAFGSGQLRLVSSRGPLQGPIFIFGVRNETAYSSDNSDTKRVDSNLLIACLAYRVFKRLKVFPNSNAMQTPWVQSQYSEWESLYRRLSRAQSERIENIIHSIPQSGVYLEQRFNWSN